MKSTALSTVSAVIFALAAALFLARFELHTDDTGVEAFLILISASILGVIHPRRAWIWGLLIASSIPLAHLWNQYYGTAQPGFPGIFVVLFVTAIAMAGAYMGVGLRRVAGNV